MAVWPDHEEGRAKLLEALRTFRVEGELVELTLSVADEILSMEPSDLRGLLRRGDALYELGRYAEAKAAAQAALDKGVRRTGDAYLILGAADFQLGNKAGAVAAYKQAAKYPESKTFAETWLRSSGNL